MHYYKIIVSYEGTNYQGWQEQKDVPSVCGTLKESFSSVFKQELSIVGASRTDAGVHAFGQVARLRTPLLLSPEHLKNVWHRALPDDIVIRDIILTDDSFHPQRDVAYKTYRYRVFTTKPSIIAQRFGFHYDYLIDQQKLYDTCQVFVGTHDFRSFCTGYEMNSTIRTINSITVEPFRSEDGNGFDIVFQGESFLRYMIRRLVGACLEISSKKHESIATLKKALAEKNPQQTLPTAPAKGLMLMHIEYKENSI